MEGELQASAEWDLIQLTLLSLFCCQGFPLVRLVICEVQGSNIPVVFQRAVTQGVIMYCA